MKKEIIYFTKLTSISVFSFIKINLLGTVSTILFAIIGFILVSKDIKGGVSPHVISLIPFFIMSFLSRPIGFVLFYVTLIASPFLFFSLGNKYIIIKIINKILMDQAENYLYPVLDKILIKLKENKDTILKNDKNYENIKAKVIQQLKNENENKLIKTIISYGLKKANLDNIDFSNENISFIEIIKTKTIQALKNVSKPSRKNIFILLLIQWIILLLIWIIPY